MSGVIGLDMQCRNFSDSLENGQKDYKITWVIREVTPREEQEGMLQIFER